MTYNYRPPPRRTYPDHLERSYDSPHPHNYGYDQGERNYENSGYDRRGPPRYPESYGPREESFGYGQGQRGRNEFGPYGPDKERRFRDPNRAGARPYPRHPPPGQLEHGGYGYPAPRGPQRSDVRPPRNGQHHPQSTPYRNDEQRVQHYQPPQYEPAHNYYGGSSGEADFQYENSLQEPQLPPASAHSNEYHSQFPAPQPFVHRPMDEPERYDLKPPPQNHLGQSPPRQVEVSSLRSPRMQSAAVRPVKREDDGNHILPPNRILEDVASPNTLAWDNPFPTFPPKSNQSGKNPNDSIAPKSLREQGNDSRSHTVSGHSSRHGRDVSDGGDPHSGARLRLGEIPDSHTDRDSKQSGRLDTQAFDQRESRCTDQVSGREASHGKPNGEHQQSNNSRMRSASRQSSRSGRNVSDQADQHDFQQTSDGEPRPASGQSLRSGRIAHLRAPIIGRHSEDSRSGSSLTTNTLLDSGGERSRTLPNAVTESVERLHLRPAARAQPEAPGSLTGYYGPEEKIYLPERNRRDASLSNVEGQAHGSTSAGGNAMTELRPGDRPLTQDRGINDFIDQYYDTTNKPLAHEEALDEDMPNFDAASGAHGGRVQALAIDDHLGPQHPMPHGRNPIITQHPERHGRNPNLETYANGKPIQKRSQAELRNNRPLRPELDTGFNFGVPSSTIHRPGTATTQDGHGPPRSYASSGNLDSRQPQRDEPRHLPNRAKLSDEYARTMGVSPISLQSGVRSDQFRSPSVQSHRSREDQTRYAGSPVNRTEPPPPPPKTNPNALPHHPAPVRPGLIEGASPNQPPKPAPIRQYNASPSPMQLSSPNRPPTPSHNSESKQGSAPITPQELEGLRQKASANPNDQATQLYLAKRFVEAASVLVSERADQRTRNKHRERYITDAYKIVKKLSSSGYLEATFYLADAYSRGSLGLEADMREAFGLYQTAAKAGHAQAAYRVAVCCEIGQEEGGGTRRDPVKAMQWYKRAATLGDTPAMYKMGIIQLKGLLGQPMNPKEAIEWLKKAADRADKENPHALHELGLLYEEKSAGNGAVSKDGDASRQLFTQAANLGYKFSQFRLGCAYEYGLMGCVVDPRQSIGWYSKAAVQEEHQSELALSGWYLTGSEGVLQQSDTEAYLWARKAAQAGLAKAEYAMGYFTEVGIGAPANLEDAKRWYWRSASQNFPKARDRLEDLRKGGATKQKTRVSRSNMKKQSDGECTIM